MSYPKLSMVVASQLMVASSDVKGNIPMALVITSPRGKTTPEVMFEDKSLVNEFGEPDLKYGKSLLYADTLLKYATNNLTVVRAVSSSSRYAGALLRAKKGDENLSDLSKPIVVEPVVQPIGGLTQEELDNYKFPLYPRERAYEKVQDMYFGTTHETLSEVVYVLKEDIFKEGMQYALGTSKLEPTGNAPLYTIKSVNRNAQTINLSIVETLVTTNSGKSSSGMLYILDSKSNKLRIGNIYDSDGLLAVGEKQNFLLMNSDYLYNGDTYNIVDDADTTIASITISSKVSTTEKVYALEFDKRPDNNFYVETFYKVTASDFEYRDSALVVSKGTGLDNRNISVGIENNRLTTNSFTLVVYYKGKEKERHNCSMNPEIDGNNIQLEIESVVNKNSRLVKVIKNKAMTDEDGAVLRPLDSDTTKWQKKAEPFYVDGSVETGEDILIGDVNLKVTAINKMPPNTRFVFRNPDGTQSKEYKVLKQNQTEATVILDRPLEEVRTVIKGTDIYKFDVTLTDESKNIYSGNITYPVTEIVGTTYPLAKGTYKEIPAGNLGYVWDGGANRLGGGSDGSAITIAEMVNALQKIKSVEQYPYYFLADGGITDSSYKRAMIQVAKDRKVTLAFMSCKLSSEYASDSTKAISDDFLDIGVTDDSFTFSADWYKMTNPYTFQQDIPMPPSLTDLLVESGAISTDGIWTASAGWRKGQYFTDGLINPKDEATRTYLYDRGINTSKSKAFKGTAKWSDLTGLNQERPLQYKSVKKLAIYVLYNLADYLEDIHFEDYDPQEITDVEGDIQDFLEDLISSGGMYDAKVVIGDLVNDRKVSLRTLPIYVAITGKQFIQGINLGLEVQQGTKTTVNLTTANKITA